MLNRLLDLVVKLVPVLLKRRQSSPSPADLESAKQAARDALLQGKEPVMAEVSPSPRGALNAVDALKLLRMAAVVAAAAALSHLIQNVPALDLGRLDDLVTPIIIMVLEALRRLVGGPAPVK